MKINTNISETVYNHDLILYLPIERQIYDLFTGKFTTVTYESDRDGFILVLDGSRVRLEVGTSKRKSITNGVRLHLIPPYLHDGGTRFGEGNYPTIKLPYNEDISDKVDGFCTLIRKVKELEKRAAALGNGSDKIEAFLNRELATDDVQVSYWNENLFSGTEIVFYLHPKGQAPADGVLVCLEKDTQKIVPFWNGATQRRNPTSAIHTRSYEETIERAVGRQERGDIAYMKARIEAIEKLKARVDAFDPAKSVEFIQLLEAKRRADDLLKEFQTLTKKGKASKKK